jgi:hypothetical protein
VLFVHFVDWIVDFLQFHCPPFVWSVGEGIAKNPYPYPNNFLPLSS